MTQVRLAWLCTLQMLAGTSGHDNAVQITGQAAQDITASTLLQLPKHHSTFYPKEV